MSHIPEYARHKINSLIADYVMLKGMGRIEAEQKAVGVVAAELKLNPPRLAKATSSKSKAHHIDAETARAAQECRRMLMQDLPPEVIADISAELADMNDEQIETLVSSWGFE